MSGYQSFPGRPGSADSAGKLASLSLPSLNGKSFLDVGCNEGFYCGYASFDAATKIVGIDKDPECIERARKRFPGVDFRIGDWEELDSLLDPEEKFDVILMASALHYSRDQPDLVKRLTKRLTPKGVLVLEIGIVENPAIPEAAPSSTGWREVKRSIDTRLFPDWSGVEAMLAPYAYKHAGKSVPQAGDPIPRHVFHISHRRPFALLMTGAPASGKSTLCGVLGKTLKIVGGDRLLCQLDGKSDANEELKRIVGEINPARLDMAIRKICENGAIEKYAALVARAGSGEDFVYDGYIPEGYDVIFADALENLGYRVCDIATTAPAISQNELSKRARAEARKYLMFLSSMELAARTRDKIASARRRGDG
ncbi:MAG: class I SAM-dependent methyltransferase [Desulfovibrio sp.]|nr:class I SAM-dependent methyltransferase [Desulfovibrio sp.]